MGAKAKWNIDKDAQTRLKKLHLLKAAAECFNDKGFSGTSLKDVANKLNIKGPAIY